MRIDVACPVRATEDADRVMQAAQRLFPDLSGTVAQGRFVGTATDVRPFRQRVWELRIIDTARGQLLHGASSGAERMTRFRLSKQAAYAGKVSFPPGSHPLGDLDVTFALQDDDPWTDLDGLVAWLCPATRDGEIVGPVLP